jgi:hypothetical protein
MRANSRLYQSYLLRMWRESLDGEWRASLQSVATSECRNFPDLEALFAYLRAETEQKANPSRGAVLLDKS